MSITSETVGKALAAFFDRDMPPDAQITERLRAALEAVEPMLIAQGMREAAELIQQAHMTFRSPPYTYTGIGAALDRAQELDPK